MADRHEGARLGTWQLHLTEPGAHACPATLPTLNGWIPAIVPGTAASALEKKGLFDPDAPIDLDAHDIWYRTQIEGHGSHRLHFGGLATIAEVYVDGVLRLQSRSMFLAHDLEIELTGRANLAIAFRALAPELDRKARRARWRPRNIAHQGLRLVRTTLLGRMPGWCPPLHAVGPWREITLTPLDGTPWVTLHRLRADHDGRDGHLHVALAIENPGHEALLLCAGRETILERDQDGLWRGSLDLAGLTPWWPHTHGDPALHDVEIVTGGHRIALARTGFRSLVLDRGADGSGFTLRLNSERIFCRGACWTTPDLIALPGAREDYEPLLRALCEANMNMVRIGGSMTYETAEFYRLCDELGLLVWQDFMFSNFDYPAADPDFAALASEEARQCVARTLGSPSVVVFCGASEVAQQAAMLGLPREMWSNALFDETFAALAADLRPDTIYVPHSPSGGAMPFEPAHGLSHYYGVSAYMRPIEDAREAGVRFAPESLGHANVPESDAGLTFNPNGDGLVQACWGERRDRDYGAVWWFETVRHHYVRELYGVEPQRLIAEDPQRYLNLSRATNAELMEGVFGLWRRHGSPTAGGLVWHLRDIVPGPGWGILDSDNAPKSVWYALKRALRPVQLVLVDDGLNGLSGHMANETPRLRDVTLELVCLREGAIPVMRAERSLQLAPRSTMAIPATELWGAFFDTNNAYRFGPPSHDVTCARLREAATGEVIAEAFHFPQGRGCARHDLGLAARIEDAATGPRIIVSTRRFAQSVHLRIDGGQPADNWFHLAPGNERAIALTPRPGSNGRLGGSLAAVNGTDLLHFGCA